MATTPASGTPPATLRLFLALWPGAAERARLAAWQDAWSWPAAAVPVDADRLHLTLHFIGQVPAARLDEIAAAFDVASPVFDLGFGHGELWPHGVAVLQPDSLPPALARLQATLADTLKTLGLRTETRPFRPHVTLARHASGAVPPPAGPALRWPVHGHVLVESRLAAPGGYRVLRRYPPR